jgi:hypothetical protein
VAGLAADAGLLRDIAEDRWRTESQIAKLDQFRPAAGNLRMKDLTRPAQRVLVQFGFRRQRRLVAVDGERQHAFMQARHRESNDDRDAAPPTNAHRD